MGARSSRQIAFAFRTWGGARPGAGRPPRGAVPGVPHVRRAAFSKQHPLHVTIRCAAGLPSLRSQALLAAVRAALRGARERLGLRICHYSVQGNHMHLIVEAATRRSLSLGMRGLGVRLARGVNRVLGRKGRVVGDRYHARELESPRSVRNALAYVLLNSARHAGRSLLPDAASSAAVFDGWSVTAMPRGTDPPSFVADTIVAPRLWLLRKGWRRRGLIDPHHVPAAGRGRGRGVPSGR